MNQQINPGTRVTFDSEHGPQAGVVIGHLKDNGNGEKYALVEIDHALSGITWNVPVSKLQIETVAA